MPSERGTRAGSSRRSRHSATAAVTRRTKARSDPPMLSGGTWARRRRCRGPLDRAASCRSMSLSPPSNGGQTILRPDRDAGNLASDLRWLHIWLHSAAYRPMPTHLTMALQRLFGRPTPAAPRCAKNCGLLGRASPAGSCRELLERGQHFGRPPQTVALLVCELDEHVGLLQRFN